MYVRMSQLKNNVQRILQNRRYYVSAHGGTSSKLDALPVPRDTMIIYLVPVGTQLACLAPAFYQWMFDPKRLEKVVLSHASCRGFSGANIEACTPLEGTVIYIGGDVAPNLRLSWDDLRMDMGIYSLPLDNSTPLYSPQTLKQRGISSLSQVVNTFGPGVYVVSACRSFTKNASNNFRRASFAADMKAIRRDLHLYNNVINTGISAYYDPRNKNTIHSYFGIPQTGPRRPWLKPTAALQAAPNPRPQTAPPQIPTQNLNRNVTSYRLSVQMAMFEITELQDKPKSDAVTQMSVIDQKHSWERIREGLGKHKLLPQTVLEDMKFHSETALNSVRYLILRHSISNHQVNSVKESIKAFINALNTRLSSNPSSSVVPSTVPPPLVQSAVPPPTNHPPVINVPILPPVPPENLHGHLVIDAKLDSRDIHKLHGPLDVNGKPAVFAVYLRFRDPVSKAIDPRKEPVKLVFVSNRLESEQVTNAYFGKTPSPGVVKAAHEALQDVYAFSKKHRVVTLKHGHAPPKQYITDIDIAFGQSHMSILKHMNTFLTSYCNESPVTKNDIMCVTWPVINVPNVTTPAPLIPTPVAAPNPAPVSVVPSAVPSSTLPPTTGNVNSSGSLIIDSKVDYQNAVKKTFTRYEDFRYVDKTYYKIDICLRKSNTREIVDSRPMFFTTVIKPASFHLFVVFSNIKIHPQRELIIKGAYQILSQYRHERLSTLGVRPTVVWSLPQHANFNEYIERLDDNYLDVNIKSERAAMFYDFAKNVVGIDAGKNEHVTNVLLYEHNKPVINGQPPYIMEDIDLLAINRTAYSLSYGQWVRKIFLEFRKPKSLIPDNKLVVPMFFYCHAKDDVLTIFLAFKGFKNNPYQSEVMRAANKVLIKERESLSPKTSTTIVWSMPPHFFMDKDSPKINSKWLEHYNKHYFPYYSYDWQQFLRWVYGSDVYIKEQVKVKVLNNI